jgi:hypothetical protein
MPAVKLIHEYLVLASGETVWQGGSKVVSNSRAVALVLLLALYSLGSAQSTFVGGGLSFYTDFQTVVPFPLLSVQVGGEVAPDIVLRGTLDTLIIAHLLSADVTYRFPLEEATSLYAGGGLDLLLITFMGMGAAVGLHGVLGLEYRPDRLGFFGEVQPLFAFGGTFGVRLRGGVNFYL